MSTAEQSYFWPTDDPNYENVDRIFQTLEGDEDADYNNLKILDQYIWNVCHFESAVCNGGLHLYFTRASSDRWRDCLQAFQAIGAGQSFIQLKKACEIFPDATPGSTWQVREQQLDEVRETLGVDPQDAWNCLDIPEIDNNLYTKLWNYYKSNAVAS